MYKKLDFHQKYVRSFNNKTIRPLNKFQNTRFTEMFYIWNYKHFFDRIECFIIEFLITLLLVMDVGDQKSW